MNATRLEKCVQVQELKIKIVNTFDNVKNITHEIIIDMHFITVKKLF